MESKLLSSGYRAFIYFFPFFFSFLSFFHCLGARTPSLQIFVAVGEEGVVFSGISVRVSRFETLGGVYWSPWVCGPCEWPRGSLHRALAGVICQCCGNAACV